VLQSGEDRSVWSSANGRSRCDLFLRSDVSRATPLLSNRVVAATIQSPVTYIHVILYFIFSNEYFEDCGKLKSLSNSEVKVCVQFGVYTHCWWT
jgi:hypothetical protein